MRSACVVRARFILNNVLVGLDCPPFGSAGLMPTEARGNYLPEPPLPITASHSSRYDMPAIISSRYQYGPFLFFVAEVVKLLDYRRAEKISLYFRRPPEA